MWKIRRVYSMACDWTIVIRRRCTWPNICWIVHAKWTQICMWSPNCSRTRTTPTTYSSIDLASRRWFEVMLMNPSHFKVIPESIFSLSLPSRSAIGLEFPRRRSFGIQIRRCTGWGLLQFSESTTSPEHCSCTLPRPNARQSIADWKEVSVAPLRLSLDFFIRFFCLVFADPCLICYLRQHWYQWLAVQPAVIVVTTNLFRIT